MNFILGRGGGNNSLVLDLGEKGKVISKTGGEIIYFKKLGGQNCVVGFRPS